MVNYAGTAAYSSTRSGTLYAVNASGSLAWHIDIGGSVTSLYDASYDESYEVVYAASTNGTLLKLENLGDSARQEWVRDLGAPISSDISAPTGSFLYVATTAGKLYKMYRDGVDVTSSEWEQSPGVTGGLFGTPVIDDYSQGVHAIWYPSTDGTFYRLNSNDGSLSVPVTIAATGIETWPYLLAGYGNPDKNTHAIYFGDNDGYFRCRNSNTLVDKPAQWPALDVNVSSPIHSSAYFDGVQYFYFGADNGNLYKVDADNGDKTVLFHAQGPIRCMPIVGDNNDVYFGSDDGCFYGLNTADGSLISGFPIVTGGEVRSLSWSSDPSPRIYFYSNDGKTYCIDVP
jgi:outer membrane protein assembly factor BamB